MKREDKKPRKNKGKYIALGIVILIILGGVFLVSFFSYQYIKDKDAKIAHDKEEEYLRKEEITEIRRKNTEALKDYQKAIEFLSTLTYDEIKNNLVDEKVMQKNTSMQIYLDDKELKEDDTITFNEIKTYQIKVILNYDYFYQIDKETKEEKITNTKDYLIMVEDTIKPVISGVKDKEITVGDKLNILEGITAVDEKEGNIEVKYEGEVNLNKAGTYNVIIYAIDQNGNRTQEEMKITVKAKKVSKEEAKPSTTKPSVSKPTPSPSTPSCDVSSSVLLKRGYKTADKDACEKNKQATVIAKQIANEVKAKGYTKDIDIVGEAARIVASYYDPSKHVEEGYDYRTPYGVFITHSASCAGCTRALIQVLELLDYKNLVHANENGWTHQWVILTMDGQKGFADGQVGMVGYGCHMVDEECN